MSRIETFRSPEHSLFQSLVEEVTGRMEERDGQTLLGGPPSEGRNTVGHPVHDVAHAIASLRQQGKEVPETPPQDLEEKHGGAIHTLWTCARLAAEILALEKSGQDAKAQQKQDELKFSTCDPLWIQSIGEYLEYMGADGEKTEIPYIRHQHLDDFVLETLPKNAKVALLGDWGTGTDDAIRTLEQVAAHGPDVLIHLGDVYYAGTPEEGQKYFLDIVNRVLRQDGRKVPVYTLTGNHDMYSGGVGYYGLLPQLNPAPDYSPGEAQPASYFCLRSPDGAWQLLAMDTGLHDRDPFDVSSAVTWLEPSEQDWHVDKVQRFTAQGGRTILLSHHQLFSAFELIGGKEAKKPKGLEAANPRLLETYRALRAATDGREDAIAAWFWGHEHNLDVYEPYLDLGKGRCIGHGAIPAFVENNPYAVQGELPDPPELVDDPRRPGEKLKLDITDQVYAHGFVILELDDAARTATARYYQETDPTTPMYEEEL